MLRFIPHLTLCVCVLACSGCVKETVVKSTWGDFGKATGAEGDTNASGNATIDRRRDPKLNQPNYAILLRSFSGDKQQDQARQFAERLHKRTNMPELWTGASDDVTNVYRGRYFDPEALDALADLRQTRMISDENGNAFSEVQMVRVEKVLAGPDASTGATAEMDLNQYFGQGLWTLQVAAYNSLLDSDPRVAAEKAAAALRKQGERAYYFHGKAVSMVTIGLFTYDEAWIKGNNQTGNFDSYSPVIKALQEKYPHNLVNGKKADMTADETAIPQPSSLVPLRRN